MRRSNGTFIGTAELAWIHTVGSMFAVSLTLNFSNESIASAGC